MTSSRIENKTETRPYKPSWIDRFNHWIEKLPVSVWLFHAVFGIMLILVQLLFLWLDRGFQAIEIMPVIIFNGLATPFLLALVSHLDIQSVTAVNSMKPMLDTTESEFNAYQYRLSNMPFFPPLAAGLAMAVFAILASRVSISPFRYAVLEELPVFEVVFRIIDMSSAFLFGVVIYHTIRQLCLVSSLSARQIRINLFRLQPLQAFSRLTAPTAIGLMVFIYLWMLINPELLSDPVTFGLSVIFSILTISIFIWPLYGFHRIMALEKERTLHDIDLRLDAVFSEFNLRFQEKDYSALEVLNGAISSLDILYRRVKAISTWPWRLDTARYVLTAVALPLILMILQFIVENAFGW